jgi:hypothetical protein
MTEQEAIARREVTVKHIVTGAIEKYTGEQVYSITDKGIVVVFGPNFTTRHLYPWHRIESFVYHSQDSEARKKIQGF